MLWKLRKGQRVKQSRMIPAARSNLGSEGLRGVKNSEPLGVTECEDCGLLQLTELEESSRCSLILGSREGREASSQPLSTLKLKSEKTKGKCGLAL